MQELERGDSGIRSFASVQGALVMYPIFAFGSEEQKQHWLPRLARGEEIGCFGLTEPDFGSNPGGMLTTARQTADGWVLNGTKMWITNGSQATVAIVWAKTGAVDDTASIRGFVVPTSHAGVHGEGSGGKALAPRVRHERDSPGGRAASRRRAPAPSPAGSRAR